MVPAEPRRYYERGGGATRDSRRTLTASGFYDDGLCSHALSGTAVYNALIGAPAGDPAAQPWFRLNGRSLMGAVALNSWYLPHLYAHK